jgi:peptidoglycan/LPS O-acetylase OafA/YrhL
MAEFSGQRSGQALAGSAKSFWESSYFPSLDGLRALSLLLVIGGHVRTSLSVKQYVSGGLGVGIFFVLSGFLITTLLLREFRSSGHVSVRSFYVRRCFRIIPPYALTILIYLSIGQLPSQHTLKEKFLRALPYDLTLRNEYIPSHLDVAFTHSWSLSVEEKFYLIWPFLFLILLRQKRLRLAIIPIVFAPLAISSTHTLPVAYFSLLLGCSVAFGLDAARDSQVYVMNLFKKSPTIVIVGLWIASYFVSIQGTWRICFVIATAVLIPKLLVHRSWMSSILGSPALCWVGKRTYSMYLLHAFCLTAVEEHLLRPDTVPHYAIVVVAAFLATLGLASVTYSLVEQPFIAVGRKLSKKLVAGQYARAVEDNYSVASVANVN